MEKQRKSAGLILFKKRGTKDRTFFEFLVIHYPPRYSFSKGHWGFVKGKIEEKEDELETAFRECEEEVGIKKEYLRIIKGYRCKIRYSFRELVHKDSIKEYIKIEKSVVFFLAEVIGEHKVKLSYEHDKYKWLNYGKAYETLSYKQEKECLKKAYARIIASIIK